MAKKKSGGSIGGFVFNVMNVGITVVMFITPTIALAYWYLYLRDAAEPPRPPVRPAAEVAPTASDVAVEQAVPGESLRPAMSSGFFDDSTDELGDSPNVGVVREPETKQPVRAEYEVRTWSDQSGKFTISAMFHSVTGGQVKLIATDDRRLDVAIAKLCDADKDYLRKIFRDKGIQPAF